MTVMLIFVLSKFNVRQVEKGRAEAYQRWDGLVATSCGEFLKNLAP